MEEKYLPMKENQISHDLNEPVDGEGG